MAVLKILILVVSFFTFANSKAQNSNSINMEKSGSQRALSQDEKKLIFSVLNKIRTNFEDKCFVNISVFKNENLVEQVKDTQKQFTDQKSRYQFLETDLTEILPLENRDIDAAIVFVGDKSFEVSYEIPVALARGDGMYPHVIFDSLEVAVVKSSFQIENDNLEWIQSVSNAIVDDESIPHSRCQQKSQNSIFSLSYSTGLQPVQYFLDLELVKSETGPSRSPGNPAKPAPIM